MNLSRSYGPAMALILFSSILGASAHAKAYDASTLTRQIAPAAQTPFLFTAKGPHQVRILSLGVEALEIRLEMIERAKRSIDLSYYIYGHSPSGVLLSQALLRKKAENPSIRIRIMLDYYSWTGSPGLDPFEVSYLESHGIEIRFFNPAEIWQAWKVGHRDHSKFLIIDGDTGVASDGEVITGGRNVSDDSFDFSNSYFNFIDTDLWVRGPIAHAARERFDQFWFHPILVPARPADGSEKDNVAEMTKVANLLKETPDTQKLREKVRTLGQDQLAAGKELPANLITLVSDRPGSSGGDRVTYPFYLSRLAQVKDRATIENYAFLPPTGFQEVVADLRNRGAAIDFVTNGFATAGGDPRMIFLSLPDKHKYARIQASPNARGTPLRIFEYNSKPLADQRSVDVYGGGAPGMFGIHSKTAVFDHRDTWIGSMNLDPRSADSNVEAGLFVRENPAVAAELEAVIARHQANTKAIRGDGEAYEDGSSLYCGMKPDDIAKGNRDYEMDRLVRFLF